MRGALKCSRCGECCRNTRMPLTERDVRRLAEAGFDPAEFTALDGGVVRLRNVGGYCYFYDRKRRACRVYDLRPEGCRLYPVVFVEGYGVGVDRRCPMAHTVSEEELREKAPRVLRLVREIYGDEILEGL